MVGIFAEGSANNDFTTIVGPTKHITGSECWDIRDLVLVYAFFNMDFAS